MQGRLKDHLQRKINKFDIKEPYVWRLKLSETEFNNLETSLLNFATEKGEASLETPENAIYCIIYIAEWYKRCYCGGNKNNFIASLNVEKIFRCSGINLKSYLYQDDNGASRWLYSIYVLGGLAIQHELNRNDNMRFLKGLCRIYHGENFSLENIDDTSRATAFRKSIAKEHSLYEYMREILNGDFPFDQSDLKDSNSDANQFIIKLKTANDEVYKPKFRFEWRVMFLPDYPSYSRQLTVILKPEEVNGGLNQYLRYDRVHLWGISYPEKLSRLDIYIKFMDDNRNIAPLTTNNPIITFLPHNEMGFVSFGVEKCVIVKHIPSCKFDRIQILAKDETGKEYLIQEHTTAEYIQLWRSSSYDSTWSSTPNKQKETALIFSQRCKLTEEYKLVETYKKAFSDSIYGDSELWNWVYIYDKVEFTDEQNNFIQLYNRIGYDQITTHLYTNCIQYIEGGKISHYYIEDSEEEGFLEKDNLPLIFDKKDIVIHHFGTKDDIINANILETYEPEKIEYKLENGHYLEWTSSNNPNYGETELRLSVKGKYYLFKLIYLPKISSIEPICRDFKNVCIHFINLNNETITIKDFIPMDGKVLDPVLPIYIGTETNFFELKIYRPTLIKEILFDGNLIDYIEDKQIIRLPYIFKDRVEIHDFSIEGYQAYQCSYLGNIYTQNFINIEGNPSIGEAALNAWRLDKSYSASLLDSLAPKCLKICFGNSKKEQINNSHKFFFWNYDERTNPLPVDDIDKIEFDVGVIFQEIKGNTDLNCYLAEDIDNDPWAWDDIHESILKCFHVANNTGIYFFLMKPLRDMNLKNIDQLLYKPLLKERNGILTPEDTKGLLRIANEFGINWEDFNINITNH